MTSALEVLHALLVLGALAMVLPAAVLVAQVIAAGRGESPTRGSIRSDESSTLPAAPSPPRIAALVPAHDEATGIAATIASIHSQLRRGDTVLVVADNCADDTAAIARAAGADVVERMDSAHRGKGFALDFGLRALERRPTPPDVLVVIDADCMLEAGAIDRVCSLALATGRPVQATYLMSPPENPTVGQRISAFAWIMRNRVRPLGARRLGWPSHLMGTGMAFPWSLAATAPFASGHLVEDLQLGIELALRGTPPLLCPDAVVRSRFPADAVASTVQRTRWEHGHLALLARAVPRLAWAALVRGRPRLLAMALDLGVPPLAAWIAVQCVLVAIALATALMSGRWLAASLSAAGLAAVTLAVIIAWDRYGRGVLSAADLAGVPAYVLGKLPIYARLLSRRETSWIRTKR